MAVVARIRTPGLTVTLDRTNSATTVQVVNSRGRGVSVLAGLHDSPVRVAASSAGSREDFTVFSGNLDASLLRLSVTF